MREIIRHLSVAFLNAKTMPGVILATGGAMFFLSMIEATGLASILIMAYGVYLIFKK